MANPTPSNVAKDVFTAPENAAQKADVNAQLEKLREDIVALSSAVSDLASTTIRKKRRDVNDAVSNLSEQGRKMLDVASERAVDLEGQAVDYVRTKPLQAMAFAAAAGLVVGWLSRDR